MRLSRDPLCTAHHRRDRLCRRRRSYRRVRTAMSGCILIFNAGSSSIKFALYGVEPLESLLFRGEIEEIGLTPGLVIHDAAGKKIVARVLPADLDHNGATREIFHVSSGLLRGQRLVAAGHRVVHGGTHYAAPV